MPRARDHKGESALGFHERIGMAAWLMTKASDYAQYPIACLSAWIEPAVLHDQIHFFFRDEDRRPIGYVTWACLAPDTEQRLLHDPEVLFHISEWNEGESLWLMDMVLIAGDVRSCIREMCSMFPNFSEAKSLRRLEDGAVQKVTVWKRARFARR